MDDNTDQDREWAELRKRLVPPMLAAVGKGGGLTLYHDYNGGEGFFVKPAEFARLDEEQRADLLDWCQKHEREYDALSVIDHCKTYGIDDPNLADWIIEAVAQGDIAPPEMRERAKVIITERAEAERLARERERRKAAEEARRQKRARGYVYLLQAGPHYKIGKSRNVDQRITKLATLPPFDLELVCTIATDDMFALERELHERFDAKRKQGEWFELDAGDVAFIMALAEEGEVEHG